jgi:hypothetical protein
MINRLLIAAIAITFAWFEPALARQPIHPRQLAERVGALVVETYDRAAITAERLAYAAAERCRARNVRES